jgi:MFS family permease
MLGWDGLRTGLTLLGLTGVVFLCSIPARRFSDRFGPRRAILTGLAVMSVGFISLSFKAALSDEIRLLAGFAAIGIGFALVYGPAQTMGVNATPVDHSGLVAGFLSSSRNVGTGLGVTTGLLAFTAFSHSSASRVLQTTSEREEFRSLLSGAANLRTQLVEVFPLPLVDELLREINVVFQASLAGTMRLAAVAALTGLVAVWALTRGQRATIRETGPASDTT